jgi:hypothetical protein
MLSIVRQLDPVRGRLSVRTMPSFPSPRAFTDFDWTAVLDTSAENRGGPPLRVGETGSER